MNDLTVIFMTANEMPKRWKEFHRKHLKKAVGDYRIITVTRSLDDFGDLQILDTDHKSFWNMYNKVLMAAEMADTEYVAIAEDDVLYTREHFTEYRPKHDAVSYDRSRWSLFTWDNIYCVRQRLSNCSLIAPRKLLIEALSERKAKYPNGCTDELIGEVGREKVEKRMGVTVRKCEEWYCTNPIVQLNHPTGTDPTQRRQWKKHGQIKAYDIPHWGKATDIIKVYNDE